MPRSFRFDRKQLEVLQSEAKRRGLSLSSLVNKLVTSYVEYGRYAEQAQALSLSRNTFSLLLNAIDDEDLKEAARGAGKSASGFITAVHGALTVSTIRQFVTGLSTHANMFGFNEPQDREGYWVFLHELGQKWSVFLSYYLAAIFAEAKIQARSESSDRGVTFRLER